MATQIWFCFKHIEVTGKDQLNRRRKCWAATKIQKNYFSVNISICGACYLAHQRPPLLDSLCRILGLVHLEGPAAAAAAAAAVALGTQLLVGPPLIHPAGIYRFAAVSTLRQTV